MNCNRRPRALLITVAVALVCCYFAPPCRAADKISWGDPVSNLRAGLAIASGKTGLELHIYFQNLAACSQSLLLQDGPDLPRGMDYAFSIYAVGPDGVRHRFVSSIPDEGRLVRIGISISVVKQLPPRGTYEMRQSLKQILSSRENIPFERLMRGGSEVFVSYFVPRNRHAAELWSRNPDVWTGDLESGDVGLPPNAH